MLEYLNFFSIFTPKYFFRNSGRLRILTFTVCLLLNTSSGTVGVGVFEILLYMYS